MGSSMGRVPGLAPWARASGRGAHAEPSRGSSTLIVGRGGGAGTMTTTMLSTDDPSLDAAADDFGHVVRQRPRAVVRPRSVDEVVALVQRARRERVPLVARGAGHSVFGQSQIADGWVVDTRDLARVQIDGTLARAGAGATWRDVVRAALPEGLSPPVLTDFVGLSVGGTLSVGGVGGGSFRHGLQTDHVVAMMVVTGDGQVRRCSRDHEGELFDHVRAGLGQLGIVVEVELGLVAAPGTVVHLGIGLPSIEHVVEALERLEQEGRFDQLSAVAMLDDARTWRFRIDAVHGLEPGAEGSPRHRLPRSVAGVAEVVATRLPALDYALRLDAELARWSASGLLAAPHPWVDVFVPDAALVTFAHAVMDALSPEDLGTEAGMLLLYPLATAATRTPLLPLPTAGRRAYLFDVLRCLPGATGARVDAIVDRNRSIYAHARSLGGTLYPISAVRMEPADWQRHFGAQWASFVAAKHRYDPDGVLGGGCSIHAPSAR